jgi:hypothetical protein
LSSQSLTGTKPLFRRFRRFQCGFGGYNLYSVTRAHHGADTSPNMCPWHPACCLCDRVSQSNRPNRAGRALGGFPGPERPGSPRRRGRPVVMNRMKAGSSGLGGNQRLERAASPLREARPCPASAAGIAGAKIGLPRTHRTRKDGNGRRLPISGGLKGHRFGGAAAAAHLLKRRGGRCP